MIKGLRILIVFLAVCGVGYSQTKPHQLDINGTPLNDIRKYKAVSGDSSSAVATQNTVALQTAVNTGAAYIPDGVWYINDKITVPGLSDVNVYGGKGATIIQTNAAKGIFDIGTFGSQNSSKVVFDRLILKNGLYAFNAASQEGLVIRDCRTYDHTNSHILLDGCYLSKIYNTRCSAAVDCSSTIKITRASQNLLLDGVAVLSNGTGIGVDIVGPLILVTLKNCDIEGNKVGVSITKREAGRLDTFSIKDSTFERNEYHVSIGSYTAFDGDSFDKTNGVLLENNYFTGTASESGYIFLDRAKDIALVNNSFYRGIFKTTLNTADVFYQHAFGWEEVGSLVTFDVNQYTNYQRKQRTTLNGVIFSDRIDFDSDTQSFFMADATGTQFLGYMHNRKATLVKGGLYVSGPGTTIGFGIATPSDLLYYEKGSLTFNLGAMANAGWICTAAGYGSSTAGIVASWSAFGALIP